MDNQNESEFISISDAVTTYKVSSNKIRKLVKENKGLENIKKVAINGKHGFKYLISVDYLNTLFNATNKPKTSLKQGKNEVETESKQDKQLDNRLINQLQATNKQLSTQIESQSKVIENLSNTIKDQNKVIVAQAMQVHQLNELSSSDRSHHQHTNTTSNTSDIKLITSDKTNNKPSVLYFVIVALVMLIIVLMWLISQS